MSILQPRLVGNRPSQGCCRKYSPFLSSCEVRRSVGTHCHGSIISSFVRVVRSRDYRHVGLEVIVRTHTEALLVLHGSKIEVFQVIINITGASDVSILGNLLFCSKTGQCLDRMSPFGLLICKCCLREHLLLSPISSCSSTSCHIDRCGWKE